MSDWNYLSFVHALPEALVECMVTILVSQEFEIGEMIDFWPQSNTVSNTRWDRPSVIGVLSIRIVDQRYR